MSTTMAIKEEMFKTGSFSIFFEMLSGWSLHSCNDYLLYVSFDVYWVGRLILLQLFHRRIVKKIIIGVAFIGDKLHRRSMTQAHEKKPEA